MMRWLCKLLMMVALSLPGAAALAQQPGAPTTAPGGGGPPPEPGAGAGQRNTTFDFVVAFAGVTLVLLIVCYPSRRY